jgi:Ca2+-binding RTX toxin-like protein
VIVGRGGDDTLLRGTDADDLLGGPGEDGCDYIASESDTFDSCDPF